MTPTTFFSLPAELRYMIYGYYLWQLRITIVALVTQDSLRSAESRSLFNIWTHFPILLTSCQVHNECLPIMLEVATFHVMFSDLASASRAKDWRRYRHITVNAAFIRMDAAWHRLAKETSMLKTVTVDLGFVSIEPRVVWPAGIQNSIWYDMTGEDALTVAEDLQKGWRRIITDDWDGHVTLARKLVASLAEAQEMSAEPIRLSLARGVYPRQANNPNEEYSHMMVSIMDMSTGEITLQDKPPYKCKLRSLRFPPGPDLTRMLELDTPAQRV